MMTLEDLLRRGDDAHVETKAKFPNGVSILWDREGKEHTLGAFYRDHVLNVHRTENYVAASAIFGLWCETWAKATVNNLIDEATDYGAVPLPDESKKTS